MVGDNESVPQGLIIGLDGNPRFADDPDTPDIGNGEPSIADMGYHYPILAPPL